MHSLTLYVRNTPMQLDVYELFVVGYINEAGELNMGRFQTFMRAVAEVYKYILHTVPWTFIQSTVFLQFDYDHYSELISDMKWLEAKTMGSKKRKKPSKGPSVAESKKKGSSEERESEEGGREGVREEREVREEGW